MNPPGCAPKGQINPAQGKATRSGAAPWVTGTKRKSPAPLALRSSPGSAWQGRGRIARAGERGAAVADAHPGCRAARWASLCPGLGSSLTLRANSVALSGRTRIRAGVYAMGGVCDTPLQSGRMDGAPGHMPAIRIEPLRTPGGTRVIIGNWPSPGSPCRGVSHTPPQTPRQGRMIRHPGTGGGVCDGGRMRWGANDYSPLRRPHHTN